jgi:hypothetical protein
MVGVQSGARKGTWADRVGIFERIAGIHDAGGQYLAVNLARGCARQDRRDSGSPVRVEIDECV